MANTVNNSPFFVSQKDFDFFNSVNEEVIDEVVGQSVDIFKIDLDETNSNIYGESEQKYYKVGFRVNCLVQYNAPETVLNDAGPDGDSSIQMRFQRSNLSSGSINFSPEVSDIVEWNEYYWEINSVVEPNLVGGSPEFNHAIIADANRTRVSNINIVERPR